MKIIRGMVIKSTKSLSCGGTTCWSLNALSNGIQETFENFSFLLVADPGCYIFNRFPITDHLVGRKVPVGIPDGNGDDDPFGFGYSGNFVQHFRI